MALVETYVDPDATGSGTGVDWTNAYTSLNAWEAAEQTDLVTDGDNHTVHLRSSSGGDDTTAVLVSGWTTDATHLITITQDDFPVDGILDATKYLLSYADTTPFETRENFVAINKIQVVGTVGNGVTSFGINLNGFGTTEFNLNNIISKCTISGTPTTAQNLRVNDASAVNIINSVFFGGDTGIFAKGGSTVSIYNSNVYGCSVAGISENVSTITAINCAVGNCLDDFVSVTTIDHCCSDDGDGTNAVAPNAGGWTDVFTDPANGDFSLKLGSNCIDAGTNTGAPSTDIIGTARPQNVTVDIGAFEYLASVGGNYLFQQRINGGIPLYNGGMYA